ncbi:hypothetical protein [Micromonospora sp. NPDC049359]|uniref:hypothetical protein n=1 Tax=Micromonospora sp. NPDC049359 TaxID=3364270 RepID=UPI0037A04B0F
MAYEEIIADPSLADPQIALAWGHATGRLPPSVRRFSALSEEVLDDLADAHGIRRRYYTLEREGRNFVLRKNTDLAPHGANRNRAANVRIAPPAGWSSQTSARATYQDFTDWARPSGQLAESSRSADLPRMLNDFITASESRQNPYTVTRDGNTAGLAITGSSTMYQDPNPYSVAAQWASHGQYANSAGPASSPSISDMTSRFESMSIGDPSSRAEVAGIPSSGAPTHHYQDQDNVTARRAPAPDQGTPRLRRR